MQWCAWWLRGNFCFCYIEIHAMSSSVRDSSSTRCLVLQSKHENIFNEVTVYKVYSKQPEHYHHQHRIQCKSQQLYYSVTEGEKRQCVNTVQHVSNRSVAAEQ